MQLRKLPMPRFRLASLFVLMLGIAIGYSLNWHTLQLMVGPPNEARMNSLPPYVIEPPDVLSIQLFDGDAESLQGISGNHLVGPDGSVNLGTAGSVYVAGQTIAQAQEAIQRIIARLDSSARVNVNISAYNSKKYYVIVEDSTGNGNVVQGSVTDNETVLDAIAHVGGIDQTLKPEIWIARPSLNSVGSVRKLLIDWKSIATGAAPESNYQLMPGDRLFISQRPVNSTN